MNNAMQLKSLIKKISTDKNISAQTVMQNYMLERLLERISLSKYQSSFILKGGFLIAAIVGLDTRSTMDMDATIRGLPLNEETIATMFENICRISANDDVNFIFKRTEEIRESADYTGYRVTLEAQYPPVAVPLKVDITTGDRITPREIDYDFKLMLEPRSIKVLAYNLETIMAEKLETVISRGDQNTRPRDFYDIYIIRQLQWQNINPEFLRAALLATSENRGSLSVLGRYLEILTTVENSTIMRRYWSSYQSQFDYAKGIEFTATCAAIKEIFKDSLAINSNS